MKRILQQVAGLVHEINNPIGYVCSNLETLGDYMAQLMHLLASYRHLVINALHAIGEQHGRITLRTGSAGESQPGRGATFRVELPMRQDGVQLQEAS